ncbi:FG-GAP-like repeat-containing protein [Nitrospira sp. MA-1]|nr:FG-GAP-like repeat-containing protein [Nitrospira sp. MA-1]
MNDPNANMLRGPSQLPISFSLCVAGFLVVLLFGGLGLLAETDAATIVIVNKDSPGEGFNDPAPFTPVGGNTATTLGQARLKAFEYAANILAQGLVSTVGIRVDARIDSLGAGILGSAGPNTVHRNFPNAPVANTWYVQSLANKFAEQDLDLTTSDISATFSANFTNWYFGLDANPPAGQFDFVTVVLHEIIHGLGFLSLVDALTGETFLGGNDAFMRWLEHHGASPADYLSMTDLQRQSANVSWQNLHFVGASLQGASGTLTAGRTNTHVQMYAPNPVELGSSVSHFTNTIKPDQLMEPGIASGRAIHDLGLAQPLLQDLGWVFEADVSFPIRNDVNGDEKADLVWRNTSTWAVAIWLMNGPTIASSGSLGVVSSKWQVAGTGDVNEDGKADVIWRHSDTGTVAVWLMNGLTVMSVGFPGSVSLDWQIASVGDVNGDGRADVVWLNTSSGEVTIWLMSGSTIASSGHLGAVPLEWKMAGMGDMNADGKADLIWRNTLTGAVETWLMQGLTVLSIGFTGGVSTDWQIAGVGDVNDDGMGDLVWRKTSNGEVAIWLMNGVTLSSPGFFGVVPQGWEIANTSDVNGDGRADIIWRNKQTGTVAVWIMNGLAITSIGFPGSASTNWKIQH